MMNSANTFLIGLRAFLHSHVRSERGATAVEYGLLVALIAAVIITLVVTLGSKVAGGFSDVNESL